MNSLYIDDFTFEAFTKFLDDLKQCDLTKETTVYLTSNGGLIYIVDLFRDVIERYQFNLVGCGGIYSSALILFLTTNTPRYVLDSTIGLMHRIRLHGMSLKQDLSLLDENKYLTRIYTDTPKEDKLVLKFLRLSKEEKKDYDSYKDVYIDASRIRKALKRSEKYFAIK